MQQVKRYLGILWIFVGIAAIVLLVYSAATNIGAAKGDIGKPIPWIIIIAVFTPISIGLILFGWYALKGEYASPPTPLQQVGEGVAHRNFNLFF